MGSGKLRVIYLKGLGIQLLVGNICRSPLMVTGITGFPCPQFRLAKFDGGGINENLTETKNPKRVLKQNHWQAALIFCFS
jgi:hypothetical protein